MKTLFYFFIWLLLNLQMCQIILLNPVLSFSNLCFIHNQKNLLKSNSRICSSFLYANLATLAWAAVSEGNTFPIVGNRDFKQGWFSL